MANLASGSRVSLSLGDNGYVNVSTNGGLGSAIVTPTNGAAQSVVFGPSPYRQKLGPYTEGAVVVLDNNTCPSFDYDEFDPASGSGSGGSLVSAATTLSATGVSPGIALNGATRVSLTFGAPTGTVTAVTAQLENAANSAPLGTVYYPTGSPRWLDIPGGVTNVQIRATSWSGTGSIPLTVAG